LTSLVIGASAGLGRSLARALAAEGEPLVLVARDLKDLELEAAHLRTIHGIEVMVIDADGREPQAMAAKVTDALTDTPSIRHILFPIGASRADDNGDLSVSESMDLLSANFLCVVAVVEALLPKLLVSNSGAIVGFGSIAAVRGRSANVTYAAAKRALESYFESLRHRLSDTAIRVQFYRLGYLDTQQAYGKRLLFPKASLEPVAAEVIANLDSDFGLRTRPAFWRPIVLAVNLLPWPLFKKLKF
jgi:short-subunit dehydrogenase